MSYCVSCLRRKLTGNDYFIAEVSIVRIDTRINSLSHYIASQ